MTVIIAPMNDVEFDYLERLQRLVSFVAGHLQGDLNKEQIELYDLTFCQAEISAAQALNRQAAGSDIDVLHRLAAYFTAEAIVSVSSRLLVRPASYGLNVDDIPALHVASGQLDPGVRELYRCLFNMSAVGHDPRLRQTTVGCLNLFEAE